MKKLTSISIALFRIAIPVCTLSSCALVTVPVKVAGKAATTSVGVAGKIASAGIDVVTPNKPEKKDEDE